MKIKKKFGDIKELRMDIPDPRLKAREEERQGIRVEVGPGIDPHGSDLNEVPKNREQDRNGVAKEYYKKKRQENDGAYWRGGKVDRDLKQKAFSKALIRKGHRG